MLQTRSMAPSLIYTVSFFLRKIYQNTCLSKLSSVGGAKDHAQKCRCLCNHSRTSIEAEDTRIILTVARIDICGRMIIKAKAFLGVTIMYSVQV